MKSNPINTVHLHSVTIISRYNDDIKIHFLLKRVDDHHVRFELNIDDRYNPSLVRFATLDALTSHFKSIINGYLDTGYKYADDYLERTL
jgi:hypothetical protein